MANDSGRQAWAMGGTIFGATVMIVLGCFQLLMGIAALAGDTLFVAGPAYTYNIDTTGWGWIHLVLGALVVLTGICLYGRMAWARAVGIVLVALSAIGNFLFLPYYPLWSMVVIALDVFVIWALATVRGPSEPMDGGRHEAEVTGRRLQREDWSQVNEPTAPRDTDQTMYPGATADDTGRQAAPPGQSR